MWLWASEHLELQFLCKLEGRVGSLAGWNTEGCSSGGCPMARGLLLWDRVCLEDVVSPIGDICGGGSRGRMRTQHPEMSHCLCAEGPHHHEPWTRDVAEAEHGAVTGSQLWIAVVFSMENSPKPKLLSWKNRRLQSHLSAVPPLIKSR